MDNRAQLILPLGEAESLSRLSALLQTELRDFFAGGSTQSKHDSLSENGHVFFQIYDFSDETVEYQNTDSFRLYERSQQALKELYRNVTGYDFRKSADPVSKDVVQEVVRTIVWRGVGEENRSKLAPDQVAEFETRIAASVSNDANFLEACASALRSYLRRTKQPLSVGLAHKRFKRPTDQVEVEKDMAGAQKIRIEASRAPDIDEAIYKSIVTCEGFFIAGAIRESDADPLRSFVCFADLLAYGQRVGYMYVIESYIQEQERDRKIRLARRFLRNNRFRVANLIKESKERQFWTGILQDMRGSVAKVTEQTFLASLTQHLPRVLNIKPNTITIQVSPPVNEIEFSKTADGLTQVKIPLRITDEHERVRYVATLTAHLDAIDVELKVGNGRAHWDGLKSEFNKHELVRTLSSGLELFKLNQDVQRLAKQAEWKSIFVKLFHSQKQYLMALKAYASTRTGDEKETLIYFYDAMSSFLDIVRHLDSTDLLRKSFGDPRKVEVEVLLRKSVEVMGMLLGQPDIIGKCFKIQHHVTREVLLEKRGAIFSGTYVRGAHSIRMIEELALLLFKDLLVNAIENSNQRSPEVTIDVRDYDSETLLVEIMNNAGTDLAGYQAMNSFSVSEGRLGWFIIRRLEAALGWKVKPLESSIGGDHTTVQVFIPKTPPSAD